MKCPYNHISETTVQRWTQKPTESEAQLTSGVTATKVTFEFADCLKEQCGAYFNGKCNYNGNN